MSLLTQFEDLVARRCAAGVSVVCGAMCGCDDRLGVNDAGRCVGVGWVWVRVVA